MDPPSRGFGVAGPTSPENIRVRDLMPGCWEDANGAVHFDIGEIHDFFGIPDTPAGREETAIILQNQLAKLLPGAKLNFRGDLS